MHEGWPCSRSELLTSKGRRWLRALALDTHARRIVDAHTEMIDVIGEQMAEIDSELRLLARDDKRLLAPQTIYGVGPVLACHLLAEIGDARRFRRARQIVRVAGLDPVVLESGESRRHGRLSKQGSPYLRSRAPAGRPTDRPPALEPRLGALQLRQGARRRPTRRAHDRTQDRPACLPRPRRTRPSSLTENT
jgi:transposase